MSNLNAADTKSYVTPSGNVNVSSDLITSSDIITRSTPVDKSDLKTDGYVDVNVLSSNTSLYGSREINRTSGKMFLRSNANTILNKYQSVPSGDETAFEKLLADYNVTSYYRSDTFTTSHDFTNSVLSESGTEAAISSTANTLASFYFNSNKPIPFSKTNTVPHDNGSVTSFSKKTVTAASNADKDTKFSSNTDAAPSSVSSVTGSSRTTDAILGFETTFQATSVHSNDKDSTKTFEASSNTVLFDTNRDSSGTEHLTTIGDKYSSTSPIDFKSTTAVNGTIRSSVTTSSGASILTEGLVSGSIVSASGVSAKTTFDTSIDAATSDNVTDLATPDPGRNTSTLSDANSDLTIFISGQTTEVDSTTELTSSDEKLSSTVSKETETSKEFSYNFRTSSTDDTSFETRKITVRSVPTDNANTTGTYFSSFSSSSWSSTIPSPQNPCSYHNCSSHGICYVNYTSTGEERAQCLCRPGYGGDNCSEKIDYCKETEMNCQFGKCESHMDDIAGYFLCDCANPGIECFFALVQQLIFSNMI